MYSLYHFIRPLAAILMVTSAWASESFSIDFPIKGVVKLPNHLPVTPQQTLAVDGTGYTTFFLLPSSQGDALFVTVVFKEDGQDGPAVFWTSGTAGQQVTLLPNLAEGVTGLNQRTFEIPSSLSVEAGQLVFTGDQSKILRVRLDWVTSSQAFVAADQSPVRFIANDKIQSPADLTGAVSQGLPDTWFGSVLDAPLQEGVEKVDENIGFAVTLKSSVSQVLLKAKILGLPLDQSVTVWINGHSAGPLQPTVPALTDAGYVADDQGGVSYAGWRSGAILLPASLLKEGENTIQIETKSTGIYIRDAGLQLRGPDQVEQPAPEIQNVTGQTPNLQQ